MGHFGIARAEVHGSRRSCGFEFGGAQCVQVVYRPDGDSQRWQTGHCCRMSSSAGPGGFSRLQLAVFDLFRVATRHNFHHHQLDNKETGGKQTYLYVYINTRVLFVSFHLSYIHICMHFASCRCLLVVWRSRTGKQYLRNIYEALSMRQRKT